MASLLTLPRELRQVIILHAIQDPFPKPESPAAATLGRVFDRNLVTYRLSHAPLNPLRALLLTCRALREDTAAVVSRIEKPVHVLDIMYARDRGLWPTWRTVPLGGTQAGTVYANFRIFEYPDAPEDMHRGVWHGTGDGGAPAIMAGLMGLVMDYIDHGPAPPRRDQRPWLSAAHLDHYTVQKIIIDVEIPPADRAVEGELVAPLSFGPGSRATNPRERWPSPIGKDDAIWPQPSVVSNEVIAAEKLAYFIYQQLRRGFSLDYYTYYVGWALYEAIGSVEIRVGGQRKKLMKTDEMLFAPDIAPYTGGNPDPGRPAEFRERMLDWRKGAVKKRQRLGLGARLS